LLIGWARSPRLVPVLTAPTAAGGAPCLAGCPGGVPSLRRKAIEWILITHTARSRLVVEREGLGHYLRDRVRLVRIPHRLHEQGQCPLGHFSLDASADGEPCLLDQLASPEPEPASSWAEQQLALEQLVDQLPAGQATALRLTLLEGLSLRAAAERLEISTMSVQRAQKKAIAALRQQLAGGGGLGPPTACHPDGKRQVTCRPHGRCTACCDCPECPSLHNHPRARP